MTGSDLGHALYVTESVAGRISRVDPRTVDVTTFASGLPAQIPGVGIVDVEFGRRHTLYALAQGVFPPGNPEGSPALPNTGELLKVNDDATFTPVVDGLNQPTSLEFIGKTAYVVTFTGEIWTIDDI